MFRPFRAALSIVMLTGVLSADAPRRATGDHRFPMVLAEHYEMFEYGCHEGNYAMTHSLKGARARDQRAR